MAAKVKLKDFKESDMYRPIKDFFVGLGYDVKGEVVDCDIAMQKNGELVIIEMKKSLNITLLYQAIERQKMTSQVYIAVPRPKKLRGSDYNSMLHILKKLEIGLITVAMDSASKQVQIMNFPPTSQTVKNAKKREHVINEMDARSIDLNEGGSNKVKLVTAYRERAIKLACALEQTGPSVSPVLMKEFGCDERTYSTLKSNHYKWFEILPKAHFALSDKGREMLKSGDFAELVDFYRKEMKEKYEHFTKENA